MLGQTIGEQFSFEALLVSYFIILVLTIELGLFFIIQKASRREQSPAWILTFSVAMFAFCGVYLVRALIDLVYKESTAVVELLMLADFLIVSVSAVAIGVLMRSFFKSGKLLARVLYVAVIVLGVASTAINAYTLLFTRELVQAAALLVGALIFPIACFPIYILWQLAKRDEAGLRKFFILIMVGVILNFLGFGLNFQRFDEILLHALAAGYPAFKMAVLVVIVAGLAMIMFGFFYIPPVDDFFWVNQLVALYVINKATRTAIFKKVYDQKILDGLSFGGEQANGEKASESAFVSGIGGITDMLSETAVAEGKAVELIDQGPVKLLLSYQGDLLFMVLARQVMPVLKSKLRSFRDDFLLFFGDMLSRFASIPEKFLSAETIATRIFGTAGGATR
ncbi:MAG: hypothetical protein JW839_20620 [Candidatus Lokiarchaeota archaeon]|nr:hypothetical protein [Candidatus Lokiarchaeota archaeon]